MGLNPKALGLTVGILAGGVWFVFMGVSLLTGFLDQTVLDRSSVDGRTPPRRRIHLGIHHRMDVQSLQ